MKSKEEILVKINELKEKRDYWQNRCNEDFENGGNNPTYKAHFNYFEGAISALNYVIGNNDI